MGVSALRGSMGIASQILIAGSIVLMFFVILSGVKNATPLNKTYFLRADTSGIAGAGRDVSQWTYFYVCGEGNQDCGKAVPDLPFGAAWVGGSDGAPEGLIGSHYKGTTSTYYYYMWRFGWVFYLLGLVFNVLGFFLSLLAPCSRLASGAASSVTAFALFWFSFAATLMTVTFVKARNEFRGAGISASLGRYAFGFTWGAWAAMFLAMVFLFAGCCAGGRDTTTTRSSSRGGIFRRNRSKRSARGSFVDGDSTRRVKDEYA